MSAAPKLTLLPLLLLVVWCSVQPLPTRSYFGGGGRGGGLGVLMVNAQSTTSQTVGANFQFKLDANNTLLAISATGGSSSTWGTVCDSNRCPDCSTFDINAAKAICRQIGFPEQYASFERRRSQKAPYTNMPILFRSLYCPLSSTPLAACNYSTSNIQNFCSHYDDIVLFCPPTPRLPMFSTSYIWFAPQISERANLFIQRSDTSSSSTFRRPLCYSDVIHKGKSTASTTAKALCGLLYGYSEGEFFPRSQFLTSQLQYAWRNFSCLSASVSSLADCTFVMGQYSYDDICPVMPQYDLYPSHRTFASLTCWGTRTRDAPLGFYAHPNFVRTTLVGDRLQYRSYVSSSSQENSNWKNVCADGFTANASEAMCFFSSNTSAYSFASSTAGVGADPIGITQVECPSSALRWTDCNSSVLESSSLCSSGIVSLQCTPPPTPPPPPMTTNPMNGTNNGTKGNGANDSGFNAGVVIGIVASSVALLFLGVVFWFCCAGLSGATVPRSEAAAGGGGRRRRGGGRHRRAAHNNDEHADDEELDEPMIPDEDYEDEGEYDEEYEEYEGEDDEDDEGEVDVSRFNDDDF